MSTRIRLDNKSVLHTSQNLANKLLNHKTYINPFTARVLDGVLYSDSNFLVSVDEILWCDIQMKALCLYFQIVFQNFTKWNL